MLIDHLDLIVTRHPGCAEWAARRLGGEYAPGDPLAVRTGTLAPAAGCVRVPAGDGGHRLIHVLPEAGPADVRGRHVLGNLPLALAALCETVVAVEFAGPPPRGAEYTAVDMTRAGARLVRYAVSDVTADYGDRGELPPIVLPRRA